jgi:putative aminopeptidase FrvX
MSLLKSVLSGVVLLFFSALAFAQNQPRSLLGDLRTLVETPAVSGYESDLTGKLRHELSAYSPKTDNVGDLFLTIGSGSPHRLIVTAIDEPGFVVSAITPDGYLRVQRLPQFGLSPLWNELHSAQPVLIRTRDGRWVNGAIPGLSVHLQPGRLHAPDLGDLDNMYVDVGATTAEQVRAAGIDVLDPLALDRTLYTVGNSKLSAPSVENRFGAAALLQMLRDLDRSKLKGTLTIAFATQQWSGSRGLIRLLDETNADELLYIGPTLLPSTKKTGTGLVIAEGASTDMAEDLNQAATHQHTSLTVEPAAPLLARSYLPQPKLPARTAQIGIAVAWATTPAQYIDANDLVALVGVLEQYVQGEAKPISIPEGSPLPERPATSRPATAPTDVAVLKNVVETYGVSDHEVLVGEEVEHLLPPWAKPSKDQFGNVILHWGPTKKGKGIVFVAHQDEIGFEVKSILPDGRLELINKGGGTPAFFAGHQVLFHTASGIRPAVLELPTGWDKPDFKWGSERQFKFVADVGANDANDAAKLGFKAGDWATVPKKYRPLLGTRAAARSFDDRFGCAALISAAWKLGPNLGDRDVTFVWSTGEELGLVGANHYAEQRAANGNSAAYVFAIDTFVSSDSPIESKRFGDALVGHGFVIRAIDNSNIVPHADVIRLLELMNADHVPVQYGVTGGGNDGSAFVRFGTTDVAMSWPLRYSHSPVEVIDTKDLDSLTNAVVGVAKSWPQ